ncbi:hypothetical protein INR49_009174 [Caranx melampygus]|nr:hypothetical protein INR49_009174 [Caranx melampygus]
MESKMETGEKEELYRCARDNASPGNIDYHFSLCLSLSLSPLMDGQIMYIQSSSAPDAVRGCDKSLGGGNRAERSKGTGSEPLTSDPQAGSPAGQEPGGGRQGGEEGWEHSDSSNPMPTAQCALQSGSPSQPPALVMPLCPAAPLRERKETYMAVASARLSAGCSHMVAL